MFEDNKEIKIYKISLQASSYLNQIFGVDSLSIPRR